MGYTTEFTGSVTVTPPLNPDEIDYLRRFADSRRMDRTAGPYAVADTGFRGPDVKDYNRPPQGQPGLWCDWTPTDDGSAIRWNGTKKFRNADEWMAYLIDTFLAPDAALSVELRNRVPGRYYDPAFARFTFDHVVDGVIDAQGEDFDDRWRLAVTGSVVTRTDAATVWPGGGV